MMWPFIQILLHGLVSVGGIRSISISSTDTPVHIYPNSEVHRRPHVADAQEDNLSSLPLAVHNSQSPQNLPNYEDYTEELPLNPLSTFSPHSDYGRLATSSYNTDQPTVNTSSATKRKKVSRKEYCKKKIDSATRCLELLPPIPIGIPSTRKAVDAACKAFNAGMVCVDVGVDVGVDDWTKKCLSEESERMLKQSITGAHEAFMFLCDDQKFRHDFLKHGNCFKKISHQWDRCSNHFIESMKRFQNSRDMNMTVHCCVRLSFLQCVWRISHTYCNRDAATLLQKMAETLARATSKTHDPPQCVAIRQGDCTAITSPSNILSFQALLMLILIAVAWVSN